MVQYSLFVLKVPLNPKHANKQTNPTGLSRKTFAECWSEIFYRLGTFADSETSGVKSTEFIENMRLTSGKCHD